MIRDARPVFAGAPWASGRVVRTFIAAVAFLAWARASFADAKPRPAPAGSVSASVQKRFPDLVANAEKARALKIKKDVPIVGYDEDTARRFATAEAEATPALRLVRDLHVLRAFDLIGAEVTDLTPIFTEMAVTDLAGWYDAERGTLFLRESTLGKDPKNPEPDWRLAVTREIVHALQDQNLGLADLETRGRNDLDRDRIEAERMLVQGDASLALLKITSPKVSAGDVRGMLSTLREGSLSRLVRVPPFFRELLAARSVDGMAFCATVFRAGGWALLNRVYQALPTTTEQVLHPEKYFSGERPADLARFARDEALRGRGYERGEEGGLGELAIRIWATLWVSAGPAAQAAAGWNGDRFVVYRGKEGPPALLWATAWDSNSDAEEFEVAVDAVEATRGALARVRGCRVFQRGARADAVCRKGRQLGLVRDVPADLAESLAAQLAGVPATAQAATPPLPGVRAP